MNTAPASRTPSVWKQPAQVWAVAFACVVAFMGIGLVDPILPAIAESLEATPVETELLFTSYLLVTGLAMLVTSWISSRIGAKATLLVGLGLIVVFAFLCAISGSVDAVIGFRAGWGLGNALFISTALATIVGAASGGSSAAIVLYEAALGLGIAVGPLLGGILGEQSWRGPFFGVVALMAIAFIAVLVLLRGPGEKRTPVKFSAPFTALRRPALAILAVAALFYNIGFFVLLAFSPFPLGFGAMGIGLTFFGWGVALAVTSVWVAPVLMRRMPRTHVILTVLPLLAVDLVVAGLVVAEPAALVVCIIVGGLLLGVMNTVLTEAVMEATDLPRSVASSAYSAVRFLGGAMAPPIAALLWHLFSATVPYLFAAAAVLLAALTILLGRKVLAHIDDEPADATAEDAAAILVGDAG
ncbi:MULTISPECIES: MFS transporter [unclassified Microbacterium]|uniref:MFS transporter n=1 Tax=unclassified Microbacterium TaxID=2609290 RepID=UPI00246856D6|nr:MULTISPECIES: MFS transporter [unclassified Microbacterium]MDH5132686.1 MFS transporter [Microbacterium sp. RD10]MDH5136197.1 MFS transporter [Microbacterium sp. RD11]MDH5145178.1 MFS transporter [Microbacterium sp. RD12]MDH5154961.1 MFS transporter [Microbacterium sp. RD06]MDH5165667.1 MFS transporter [Microbacterium sp. RD02]